MSDRASSTRPFVVGQDFDDFSDKYELVKKLEYYLANEDACQRIAAQGFATASKYDNAQTCQVIVNAIHELLSARESLPNRLIHWGQARVRTHYMDLRDGISLKRRSFLARVE